MFISCFNHLHRIAVLASGVIYVDVCCWKTFQMVQYSIVLRKLKTVICFFSFPLLSDICYFAWLTTFNGHFPYQILEFKHIHHFEILRLETKELVKIQQAIYILGKWLLSAAWQSTDVIPNVISQVACKWPLNQDPEIYWFSSWYHVLCPLILD